jgi:hypothetical protein
MVIILFLFPVTLLPAASRRLMPSSQYITTCYKYQRRNRKKTIKP